MVVLAFVLECAAIAALVACASSLAVVGASFLLRASTGRISASRRADAALLLSTLPGVATVAVVGATAIPPLLAAFGLYPDDCFAHSHHPHLCLVHLGDSRPAVMALGAAALALLFFRVALRVERWRTASTDVALLESLGRLEPSRFPIVWVPGAPRLCLAAGIRRRRILVSASLTEHLTASELAAALAHERAHLRRNDPLITVGLQLTSLVFAPFCSRFVAQEHAACTEEACDAEAADELGDPALVAEALVRVAALASRQDGPALAFGRHALERRVRALLALPASDGASARAPLLLGGVALFVAALLAVLSQSPIVHHAVETILHDLL